MPGVSLSPKDRVRILAGVARRGSSYVVRRTLAITASLGILVAVPLLGLVRIDVWQGHHLVLGEPANLFTTLKAFIIALAILYGFTFLTNMVIGRFFCGWGCPVGFVSRLGEAVDLKKKGGASAVMVPEAAAPGWFRRLLAKPWVGHLLGAGFVATFVGSILLWWIDPRVMIDGSWKARLVTLAVFLTLCAGGYLHAFKWRFGFCVKACPIGIYYRYVTSEAPVGIVFEEVPNPCIRCGACESVCPVGIDPKNLGQSLLPKGYDPNDIDAASEERYGDAECIRCGDCVEACRMIFAKRPIETPPLRFGRNVPAGGKAVGAGTAAEAGCDGAATHPARAADPAKTPTSPARIRSGETPVAATTPDQHPK